jgi:hypothetical protein
MISLEVIDNVFELEDLNLESNLKRLNSRDKRNLTPIKAIKAEEKAYVHRELPDVLKNFLLKQLDENKVYWVMMEPYPQTKNPVRSKKGLFYLHKNHLGKKTFFDYEHEINSQESMFAGIVRLTPENMNYCLKELWNSQFAFGLITSKNSQPFGKGREAFLRSAITKGLIPGKIYWKNWLKLSSMLVSPKRRLFYLKEANNIETLVGFFHANDEKWPEPALKQLKEEILVPVNN